MIAYRIFILFEIIFILSLFSCKKNSNQDLIDLINTYKGKPDAINTFEKKFINLISINSLNPSNLYVNENVISYVNNNIKVIYPFERSISIPDIGSIELLYIDKEYLAVSNKKELILFDKDENKKKEILSNGKSTIEALIIFNDKLIYYKESRLYVYDSILDTNELFINEVFKSPYDKEFKVKLYKSENYLGILAGAAGSYYYSIIDLSNNRVQAKNIAVSSSKLYMDNKDIYYISGKSGDWKLIKYGINNKTKTIIHQFNDIIDIEIADGAYIYEDCKGLWISNYNNEVTKIPFNYKLFGKCKDMLLLHYNDNVHIIDIHKFAEQIKIVKEGLPELFLITR